MTQIGSATAIAVVGGVGSPSWSSTAQASAMTGSNANIASVMAGYQRTTTQANLWRFAQK